MKNTLFILPLIAVAIACLFLITGCQNSQYTASADSADALKVSVMTFNIRYATFSDGANAWPARMQLVSSVISDADPDILCLQEALKSQLSEIEAMFPGYARFGAGRDDGIAGGEHSPVLYRKDRFDLVDGGNFWFSETPLVPGSKSWEAACTRICSWVRLADKATGRHFYVYNMHWDHESARARDKSAQMLVETISSRDYPDPFIVTGDLNAGDHSREIRRLKGQIAPINSCCPVVSMFDTYKARHPSAAPIATYHNFRGVMEGAKIDYVMACHGSEVLAADIVRTSFAGRYPSDHFPVTATVVLPYKAR